MGSARRLAPRFAVAALALFSATCSADFGAALRVTLQGAAPGAGGGYWVTLVKPDGGPLEGVGESFVEFEAGPQEFAVVLKRAGVFGSNRTAPARLNVRAVPGRDAAAVARGSALVTLKRGEVVAVTLPVEADPRPLAGTVEARFEPKGAAHGDEALSLTAAGLAGGDAFALHLWLTGTGGPRWLGVLASGAADVPLGAHAAFMRDAGLQLAISAEPKDSPEPLAAPSGWIVFSGGLPKALVNALISAPDAPDGYVAPVVSLLETAIAHKGFALDSVAYNDRAGATTHCEHVYTTFAGEEAAETDVGGGAKAGDLTADGTVEYVHGERTGLGATDAQGYRKRLKAALTALEGAGLDAGALLDANRCRVNLGAATDGALAAAKEFSGNPLTRDKDAFIAAVDRVRGDPYAPGQSADPAQTTRCVEGALTALARFAPAAVAPGTD